MTTINLLPWREARRKQQQQDFIIMLAVAAVIGGLVFFGWNAIVSSQVENQQNRNRYIERELAQLDQQIREINTLERRREELVSRMNVIQNLQNSRPYIVYVFDQLVKTLPDGVYYTSIERRGNTYTVNGVADSNNRISALMRNLTESPWFKDPVLRSVAAEGRATQANRFVLVVTQDVPKPATEASEGGAK
jgi:type IV pilus assembly protein PilN